MKTTIDIPDALAAEARSVARDTGTTLRDLMISGLRSEIERRSTRPQGEFRLHVMGGNGLRVGVDPSRLTELAYE